MRNSCIQTMEHRLQYDEYDYFSLQTIAAESFVEIGERKCNGAKVIWGRMGENRLRINGNRKLRFSANRCMPFNVAIIDSQVDLLCNQSASRLQLVEAFFRRYLKSNKQLQLINARRTPCDKKHATQFCTLNYSQWR